MNFLSGVLRPILDAIYHVVPNYGWAVILFTVAVRMLLLPLDIKSKRSMKRMSDVQPRINALNQKYANDKETLNRKMMELYRKEKIKPMAGCWPMIIQMFFLFGMFSAMREAANEQTVRMLLQLKDAAEYALANNLQNLAPEMLPELQSWFWIKNVFQPDSFMSTIMPAFNDKLMGIQAVGGSEMLTQANLEAVRAFLSNEDLYAFVAQHYGTNQTITYPISVLITTINITLPSNWHAFANYTNGFFILPLLAAGSQLLSTKLMPAAAPAAAPTDGSAPNPNAGMGKMMTYFFPIFSLWICATSNAVFALYWVAANVIQIIQTLVINKWMDAADAKKKGLESKEAN